VVWSVLLPGVVLLPVLLPFVRLGSTQQNKTAWEASSQAVFVVEMGESRTQQEAFSGRLVVASTGFSGS